MDRVVVGDQSHQTLNQVLDANVTRWLRIWVTGPFVGLCGDKQPAPSEPTQDRRKMMKYEGHGRPWERRERASARAPLYDGRGVMKITTSPLVLTGEPACRGSQDP